MVRFIIYCVFYRDKNIALKDLDFIEDNQSIDLEINDKEKFLENIQSDCSFFTQNKIIDYSLLIGVYQIPSSLKTIILILYWIKMNPFKFSNNLNLKTNPIR